MFKTLFTVKKKVQFTVKNKVQRRTQLTAYFYTFKEAEQFAKKLASNTREELLFTRHNHPDGSILLWWQGDVVEIMLDDNSWMTDTKSGGVRLMPLGLDFIDEKHINNFIKNSQKQ